MTYVFYTDGSLSNKIGGAGIVAITPENKKFEFYKKVVGECTNNMAELHAILLALKLVPDTGANIIIFTDSEYCKLMLTSSDKFILKNWKTNTGKQVAN